MLALLSKAAVEKQRDERRSFMPDQAQNFGRFCLSVCDGVVVWAGGLFLRLLRLSVLCELITAVKTLNVSKNL